MSTEIDFSIEKWESSKLFDEQNFTEETMLQLINFLAAKPHVCELTFNSCSFDNSAIKLFAQIKTLPKLEFYKIKADCGWLEYITGIKSLEILILNDCKLSDQCIKSLITLPKLYKLELIDNKITDAGAKTLSAIETLRELDLSSNHITDDGVEALTTCKKLFSLNLGNNFIGDKGAIILAKKINPFWKRQIAELRSFFRNQIRTFLIRLKKLDFKMDVTAELAAYDALESEDEYKYKGTAHLYLYDNHIGDAGAIALGKLQIQTLNLSYNKITDSGAKALFKSRSIKSLDLSLNMISNKALKSITWNTTLSVLKLNQCHINDDGAKAIAKNTKLKKLSLYRNYIGDKGAQALANCKNLSTLVLTVKLLSPDILELFHKRVYITANSNHPFSFYKEYTSL